MRGAKAAVNILAHRDPAPALAHLPAGTTNVIVRAFGIEDDLDVLAEHIVADEVRTLNLEYLEDRDHFFPLGATIGAPSRVVPGASRI